MKILLWLLISFAPGWLGGKFQPGEWYNSLPKAPWSPPKLAFPIVWTVLYALMGVSSWLVFRENISERRGALMLFFLQLVLNGLWSWIFFGAHQIGWALVELMALWGLVLATLVAFWKVLPLAGGLMIPYLIWTTVAFTLNGYIWLKTNSGSGS